MIGPFGQSQHGATPERHDRQTICCHRHGAARSHRSCRAVRSLLAGPIALAHGSRRGIRRIAAAARRDDRSGRRPDCPSRVPSTTIEHLSWLDRNFSKFIMLRAAREAGTFHSSWSAASAKRLASMRDRPGEALAWVCPRAGRAGSAAGRVAQGTQPLANVIQMVRAMRVEERRGVQHARSFVRSNCNAIAGCAFKDKGSSPKYTRQVGTSKPREKPASLGSAQRSRWPIIRLNSQIIRPAKASQALR